MLAYMAHCALQSMESYRQKGIPCSVFLATMQFLSRFYKSDRALFGYPVFRWGWWFPRQLALKEFRIGIFEYEMTCRENADILSLHIPSDANLTDENIRCSFADAHAFFTKFYPLYANVVMPVCTNSVSSACFFIKAIPTRLRSGCGAVAGAVAEKGNGTRCQRVPFPFSDSSNLVKFVMAAGNLRRRKRFAFLHIHTAHGFTIRAYHFVIRRLGRRITGIQSHNHLTS